MKADHLPECQSFYRHERPVPVCICSELRACETRVSSEFLTPAALAATGASDPRYTKGFNDALVAARVAVAALGGEPSLSLDPIDCNYSCNDGACTCSGMRRVHAWTLNPADALAAIDGLKGDGNE